MSFQLKDFVSITAAMINRAKATQTRVTDFNVGSVARTLIEAPAIEIEELYQRMFAGIMDAIPTAIYRGFSFAVLEPAKARGPVTIAFGGAIDAPYTLPAGTTFLNVDTGLRYLLETAITAQVGDTAMTGVLVAQEAGSDYNTGANAVTVLPGASLPVGATITHPPITSGRDGESEVERASRFADYVQSLSLGTVAAVRYGASTAKVLDGSGATVEYVSRVGIEERVGDVKVYIHGAGATASPALIAAAQKLLDGYYDGADFVPGYRPVGVNVLVLPMVEQSRNVTVAVTMASGVPFTAEVEADIVTRIGLAIDTVEAGGTLYADDLRTAALGATGVTSARLAVDSNYPCPANVVLVPGAITVQAA